jgi:hypothetical protein
MWKVLGKEAPLVAFGDVWKERLVELSKRRKGKERFLSMLEKASVRYTFDAIREVHAFVVHLPVDFGHADLEFFKEFLLKEVKGSKTPVVDLDGVAQKYTVVITSEPERDEYFQRYEGRKKELKSVPVKTPKKKSSSRHN